MHERSQQVEFNEHLKQLEEKEKQATADRIKHDIEVYRDEEEKRKEREYIEKMERKAENIQMYAYFVYLKAINCLSPFLFIFLVFLLTIMLALLIFTALG